MDTAQKVKVSEEAKQEMQVSRLDKHYDTLAKNTSNESVKQLNIAYNKDKTSSSANRTESTIKVHIYSKEAERTETLMALADHAVKTTENFKLVLEGLKKV